MKNVAALFVRSKTVALQLIVGGAWLAIPDAREFFCNHSTAWVLAHCGMTILARVIQPDRRAEIHMIKGDKLS